MKTNKKELYELLDLMQDNNLTKYGRDKLNSMVLDLELENQELIRQRDNYKSRCEKANEYIKENKDKYYHDWGEDDGGYDTYLDEAEIDKLSNILNGANSNE